MHIPLSFCKDNIIQQIHFIGVSWGISVDGKNNKILEITASGKGSQEYYLIHCCGEGIEIRDVKCENDNSIYNAFTYSSSSYKFINVFITGTVVVRGNGNLFENVHSKKEISVGSDAKNIVLENCSSPILKGADYCEVKNCNFSKVENKSPF